MTAIPSAIIFVNNDLSAQVLEVIVRQLHIDIVLTGDEFDATISIDSNYPDAVKQLNQRILVIRPFNEYHNRGYADVVVFVKEGMAAVETKKNGPPGKTYLISKLHWGQIIDL